MAKKYHIITFGCQINKSDSQRIAAVLEEQGYKPLKTNSSSKHLKEADLIVVNMCSVRQSAVDRVYGQIKNLAELKAKNKKLKIILTGCILKSDRNNFSKNFDLIFSIKDLPKLPQMISRKKNKSKKNKKEDYLDIELKHKNEFSALVPISNGCSNFCTYCVVPYTRGPLICRSHTKILKEIKKAVKNGAKEIWLLGQNVNHYYSRQKTKAQKPKIINFPKLLKMINNIPGNFWIRFTSPNPADFSNELIEAMAKCEKITPYLNLPLQSGDNTILRKMNRKYTAEEYKKLVKKIKKAIPEIYLSTDIIVGFPGETIKQFKNTAKLMKEVKFDMAYIAQYSPRPGTAAAKLKDNVSQKEKKRREKILTAVLEKTALNNNKKYIGKTIDVLLSKYKDGFLFGKSFHYRTVKIKGKKDLVGKFVKVKITNALPWGLNGKLLN